MKKALFITAACLSLMLTACGGSEEKKSAPADSASVSAAHGPIPADNDLTRTSTVKQQGQTFYVEIRRYVDKQLPTVKDELGQDFYDNSVEVTIQHEGTQFFRHTFSKEDFAEFLSEEERRTYVFLGMAYDDRKAEGRDLCLAAQLGQPGTGEGPAFTIEIPIDGGAFSIVRDTQQETMKQEELGA